MASRKASDAKIEAALRKCGGIKALAAKALKMDRSSIQERVERSPRLQQAIKEAEEETLDSCEADLLKDLKKDKAARRWYLERKGKKRGYATKVESETKLADEDIAAIISAFGGNIEQLKSARAKLESPGSS